MLHLKQILHKHYTTISHHPRSKTDFPKSFPKKKKNLAVSGESWETAIKPDVAREYSIVDGSDIYLKFVVATSDDFDEVTRAVEEYKDVALNVPFIPCLGGRLEEYNPNVKEVAEACMERGWRSHTQDLNALIPKNVWGT